EPEVSEPEVSEPEVSEPDVSEPDVSEPEISEPETVFAENVEISSSKEELYPGETATLTVTVTPEEATDKSVTWEIDSGSEYATLSADGVLTAKAAGIVVVKATTKDGSDISAFYTITVKSVPASSITISGDKEVTAGGKITLTATVKPEDADKNVTWTVESGERFASISADGVLTAVAPGEVVVKAAAKDGSGVSATYTVTVEPVMVTSITISGGTTVVQGKTITLSATVKPDNATNKDVTWSIESGSQYASISASGVLTAKAAGKVTVKATAKDGSGVTATYTVTVKPILVSSITISGDKEVKAGGKITLTATVKPDNAENKGVTWSIQSGSSYASISSDGVLTAKAAGKVTVKATAKDGSGVSATYTVTVKAGAMWEGEGTKSNPFLIKNLTDLKNLQKVVDKKGYYFLQVADIDCSSVDTWIVIGDWDNPFRHHYDGGGYTISNICYDGEAQSLFSHVEGSHFKNMNIVNAHTKDNHRTEENRTDKQPGGGESTAAIVGYGSGCSFENCTAVVNFLSSNSTTGGLIGGVTLENKEYVLMKNCHVSGTITGGGFAGGLIGNIGKYMADGDYSPAETITIENCSADVEIIIFTSSTETPCVGGLIGESFGVKIEKCHATGSINVIRGDIGGLVGNAGNYTDILRCYASVDIYASSDNHYGGVTIGGLIGHIYSRSDVIDCYATGNISAPYVEWSPCQDDTNRNGGPWRRYYNPCGSLIGCLEVFKAYSEDEKITVYNCYATGIVDVPNICEDKRVYCHGALIGLVLDRNTVLSYNVKDPSKKELTSWDDFTEYHIGHFEDNYNLEDLRTYYEPINEYAYSNTLGLQNPKFKVLPTHDYVEIITEAQLLDQSTFEGWDFENVWVMTEDGPKLR
ncbi:MAG: Ig-like domain-containing protein, partial [Clostridia bacterium]|nr:Ig-like domain-containing protein [Clostridia bacterium]